MFAARIKHLEGTASSATEAAYVSLCICCERVAARSVRATAVPFFIQLLSALHTEVTVSSAAAVFTVMRVYCSVAKID